MERKQRWIKKKLDILFRNSGDKVNLGHYHVYGGSILSYIYQIVIVKVIVVFIG